MPGKAETESQSEDYLAAIRLRGGKRIHVSIQSTLEMLNLRNQHNLVFLRKKPNYEGMLRKVKDYITWGQVSPGIKAEVESKKTEKDEKGKPRKVYRLNPPRGGFERQGLKTSFSQGGACGERNNMDKLIKKMM